MPSRKIILIASGAVACTLAGVAIGTTSGLRDPEDSVGVISISDSRLAPGAPVEDSGESGTRRQVAAFEDVAGMVEYERGEGEDLDDLVVGRVELDFGPSRWVRSAEATEDYDGDGSAEVLRDELRGLVGNEARFLVRFDDDGDDADVYSINDRAYRDPASAPPWAVAAAGGEAASEDDVRRAAADAVGEGATVDELEFDDDGSVGWEAEVTDTSGAEHDVDLDAAGKVLRVESDD